VLESLINKFFAGYATRGEENKSQDKAEVKK
jgi:hypothetical protein